MTTPTTVQVQIQLRADTAANWTSANPTLLANEVGLETDTKKLKVGNGSTAWNSLAYFPSIVTGGTVLGNLEIGSTGTLTFEGSTANGFETTLAVTDPTADRTITLPNQSGTVVVSGNASIVDADIAANAEIAVSKLADGAARQLLQTDAAGTGVEWTDNVDVPGTLDVTGAATFDASVTIEGDLTVNGTETIINTQTLEVEDKNVILGNVDTPTDTTADGGGITLKGATDKTINWVDATDAWTLSEHVNIATGKEYRIAGTKVLDATSLGSSVLITSANITDGTIVDGDISASAEIAVSKLADGSARQLLQTDAAGTGVEWASNIDVPGTLDVTGATTLDSDLTIADKIIHSGDTNTAIRFPAADTVTVETGGSERARIDSSGRLLLGTSNSTANIRLNQKLAVVSTGSGNYGGISLVNYGGTSPDTTALLDFCRSRGTTDGSYTEVTTGDTLGVINFRGADGAGWSTGASIIAYADGTWTDGGDTTDSPGRLVFSTTADGASFPTERMRIDSAGTTTLTSAASSAPFIAKISTSEVARIDSSGRLLVGTSSANGSGLIQTSGIQTWQAVSTANVFRLAKRVAGTGITSPSTILSITVPADYYFISIEATYIGSRAPSSGLATSRVAKEMYTIARNGSGFDVVIDSNINSLDFEVGTTTAGSTRDKRVMAPALARSGAEANTASQAVAITLNATEDGDGTGYVLAYFDICVLGDPTTLIIS